MKPFLEVRNVSYAYHTITGETPAVKNVSFHIDAGEFVSVIGPSGCGKSTLLSLICGLLAPEQGEVLLNGKPIAKDASVGYMLQKDHLFEWRTIRSNLLLGLEIQHGKTAENLQRLDHLLEEYGLATFANKHPSELSGGMRQRAALIRTLLLNPELLLLDEPFSALDYQTRLHVCDDVAAILKKEQKTALLITHDIAEAISMSDRVLVLSARPGTIQKEISFAFPPEARTPCERRNTAEFPGYFNSLWKELNSHE